MSDSGDVSVIVPTVNAPVFTACIQSLQQYTIQGYELVIVCDEPTPQKMDQLRELEAHGAKVIVNYGRVGVPAAFNQGMRSATRKYVLLANDDLVFTGNWLEPLLLAIDAHPEFGYVAPIIQRASRNRKHYFAGIAECSLHTQESIDKVGLFNEDPAFRLLGVDGDYWVRVRRAGYDPHGVVESTVHHLVAQTINALKTRQQLAEPMNLLAARYGKDAEYTQNQHELPVFSLNQSYIQPPGSIYITADRVNMNSGGGKVATQEYQALVQQFDPVTLYDGNILSEVAIKMPQSPFTEDYITLAALMRSGPAVGLAHFYSGCFSQTVGWIKAHNIPITYTVPAHNRQYTVEEFSRLGQSYPYTHISDESLWSMYFAGVRNANLVIAPSNHSAQFLAEQGCQNIVIIPHGIAPEDVPATPPPLPPPERFAAGYLGQIGPDKGLIYLLRAWGWLNYPETLCNLRVGGNGTQLLHKTCQEVHARGVQLLGYVKHPKEVYENISVYVQPSVTEGFGIECLEAMAYGRPVICSTGAGAADVVQDGINGFKVPPRDAGALADRIDWCRKNPDKVVAMGQQARQTAIQYLWPAVHKEYASVWYKLLGG